MHGVTGNVLILDLEQKTSRIESLAEDICAQWLGGAGLCLHLYSRFGGEKQVAVLAPGLLTGTGSLASCSSFMMARGSAQEPPSFAVLKDHFGAEVKYAGFDALVLHGKSSEPLYLQIGPNEPKFLSARHLWGMTTEDAERSIREQAPDPWSGREMQILSIGPAGERQAPLAGLVINGWDVAGSRGLGQVFGECNLKGLAVSGNKSLSISKPGPFLKSVSSQITALKDSRRRAELNEKGAVVYFEQMAESDLLYQSQRDVADGYTTGIIGKKACFSCPVGCLKWLRTSLGEGYLPEGDAFLSIFGDSPKNHSSRQVLATYWECTRYGIDFPSFLATIRLADQLHGSGGLDLDDLGWPLPENWEETASIVERIGRERKQGCLLAQEPGEIKRWSESGDKLSERDALYPNLAWDRLSRTRDSLGTGGARTESINMLALAQDLGWTGDFDQDPAATGWGLHALGVCHLAAPVLDLEGLYQAARLATGLEITPALVREVGERIANEMNQPAREPVEA